MVTLQNRAYSALRGFNYQPSYAGTGIQIWSNFNFSLIEIEVARARKYFPKANVLRLWLSFDAFLENPKQYIGNFEKMLEIADGHGFQAIPVFFNNWHSLPDFGGVSAEMVGYWNNEEHSHHFTGYVAALVKPRLQDPRIAMWDLCNEPFNGESEEAIEKIFMPWLKRLYGHCKELGAIAPVTVGVPAAINLLKWVNPVSDVLTCHAYYGLGIWIKDEAQFSTELDALVTLANEEKKSLVATETGWGSLDDQKRAELLAVELHQISERGIGFCIHLLHHSLVADAHPTGFGPVSGAGYMACINADGSLRRGHEIINNYL